MRSSFLAMAAAALLGAAAGVTPAAAQWFDGGFSQYYGFPPAPPGYGRYRDEYGAPLNVIIRPRRRDGRARAVVPAQPAGAVPPVSDSKPKSFTRVDVEKNPDWHLKDPTLRWGDIVVLKRGPVVFEGVAGAAHRPEAFVSLDRTRTLSRAGQNQVRSMASGIYAPP